MESQEIKLCRTCGQPNKFAIRRSKRTLKDGTPYSYIQVSKDCTKCERDRYKVRKKISELYKQHRNDIKGLPVDDKATQSAVYATANAGQKKRQVLSVS